ncbi:MAG: hypothetical protein U0103_29940 [Candidatus Obscuribacterales bacterium]
MGKHHQGAGGADTHGGADSRSGGDTHQIHAGSETHSSLDAVRHETFGCPPKHSDAQASPGRVSNVVADNSAGGTTTHPTEGSTVSHPTEGGTTTHPTEGGVTPPPTDGGVNNPPTEGGETPPPPTDGSGNPPPRPDAPSPRRKHHHDGVILPPLEIVGPFVRIEADNGNESTITTSPNGGNPSITVPGRPGVTIR